MGQVIFGALRVRTQPAPTGRVRTYRPRLTSGAAVRRAAASAPLKFVR
jgi:hypothetical protein